MLRVILTLSYAVGAALCGSIPLRGSEPVSFQEDLAPILVERCVACHGPDIDEGGYRVDSYKRLAAAGDSGQAGVVPHFPEQSELFRRIVSDDPGERMPLDADPLGEKEIALFQRWIDQGAAFDGDAPGADLRSLLAPLRHPDAPETYPFTLPLTAMTFSRDGSQLLVGGYHELTVWNSNDGSLLRRIPDVGQRTRALTLSPNGERLAVGSGAPGQGGETRLFHLVEDASLQVLSSQVLCSTADEVIDAVFSPQGDRLAVGAADGIIRVFGIPGGSEQMQLTNHSDFVMTLAWNADGSKLASGSQDGTARVFDTETGDLLTTYSGHGDAVMGVAFHPEAEEVFSGGGDRKLHRWRIDDAEKLGEITLDGDILTLAIDGELMYASLTDNTVRTWDATTQERIHVFDGFQDWPTSVAFHRETMRLAAGGFDGRVTIWDAESGAEVGSTFVGVPGYESE